MGSSLLLLREMCLCYEWAGFKGMPKAEHQCNNFAQ